MILFYSKEFQKITDLKNIKNNFNDKIYYGNNRNPNRLFRT